MPLNEAGIVLDKEEFEVGLLEYRPAGSNRELKLDLTQAVCTGKGDNNEIYNLKASDLKFNKIVTVKDE